MKEKEYSSIKIHISNKNVGYIKLNRPEIHNAFDDNMIQEITNVFLDWKDRDDLRLIVFQGEGKSFCAGADVNWMKRMKNYTFEENVDDAQKMASMFHLINKCPVPTIAYVHGYILGGGVGLISCCDYVLAQDSATFGLTEAVLGLIPAVISPFAIAKMGESYARAYMLSGHRFNAQKALEIGLIHNKVDASVAPNELDLLIKQFLHAAPLAQRKAKFLINEVLKDSWSKGLKEDYLTVKTANFIAQTRAGAEAQEGMGALLEKRKPDWRDE